MGEIRQKRIESAIKEIIGGMILRHDIKDPRLNELVCITNVSVSKDTKHARVYISYYGEAEICTKVVETLNHAAGFIQGTVGAKLRTRNTPRLMFIEDHSIENAFRITNKLRELTHENTEPVEKSDDESESEDED
jgi:ribosome-binding factor A